MTATKHGLAIDWAYQRIGCDCGWGGTDETTSEDFLEHLAAQPKPRKPRPKPEPVKLDYTREELIEICEAAIVPMKDWLDRDSYAAHKQLGECWALLKADVPFRIDADTDHRFIHVTHYDIEGFNYHEYGEDGTKDIETSYLPTRARLDEIAAKGWKDWYG